MSMTDFDLSDLNLTADPETIEPDAYVKPYNEISNEPIDKGIYDLKLVDGQFKDDGGKKRPIRLGSVTSKKNGKTYLSAEFCIEVNDAKVGGKIVGTRKSWARVNAIPESVNFTNVKKGREQANSFADMLIAAGWKDPLTSNDDYLNALLTVVEGEAELRGRTDWSAYSNPNSTEYAGTGDTVRGMDNFPAMPDGSFNPRIEIAGAVILARNDWKGFYPTRK